MIAEIFSNDIVKYNFVASFLDGVDRDRQLSKNFTLGEFYDATFMLNEEWEGVTEIPLHKNAIKVAQLVRDYLGFSIQPTSAFRSVLHDLKQGRKGTSQHNKAFALDLKGKGISKLIRESIETKNQLYKELRELGVNGFGIYDTFVHLDFRESKPNNEIYYWDFRKKKGDEVIKNEDLKESSNYIKYIPLFLIFLLVRKPIMNMFRIKRRYKLFTTKFINTGNSFN